MFDFLSLLFDTSDFPARWHCGNWSPGHGWLHVVSDSAIFLAYAAIPFVIVLFALRRKDLPFLGTYWMFAAFILSCGTVHLVEASIFWMPWYRFSGLLKLGTAIISWGTVFQLMRLAPELLNLHGLSNTNRSLRAAVKSLKESEQSLHLDRDSLSQTVRDQTRELQESNMQLSAEVAERKKAEQDLKDRTIELERFNEMLVGREIRMIELKNEINLLCQRLGDPDAYDLSSLRNE